MSQRQQTQIRVHRAGEGDARVLLFLIRQFAEESGVQTSAVTDEIILAKAIRHLTIYIAWHGDDPLGYVLGMESLGGRGSATPEMPGYYLADLFVQADWRGNGLGRALLSAMLQTPTAWGEARFVRWEMATGPEGDLTRAFYDRVLPDRHVGIPFVWEAPSGVATVSPERYMAFRPRRLMTQEAWLTLEPAFATDGGRWFARLHELAGKPSDYPQLLDAIASDGFAYLSLAEGFDMPFGSAEKLIKGAYRLDGAEACLFVFADRGETEV